MDPHWVTLLDVYASGSHPVSVPGGQVRLREKARPLPNQVPLLMDLRDMGIVEIEGGEGDPFNSPLSVTVTRKGAELAEHMIAVKRIIDG